MEIISQEPLAEIAIDLPATRMKPTMAAPMGLLTAAQRREVPMDTTRHRCTALMPQKTKGMETTSHDPMATKARDLLAIRKKVPMAAPKGMLTIVQDLEAPVKTTLDNCTVHLARNTNGKEATSRDPLAEFDNNLLTKWKKPATAGPASMLSVAQRRVVPANTNLKRCAVPWTAQTNGVETTSEKPCAT